MGDRTDAERPRQRKAKQVAHSIRTYFIAAWRDRPITDIGRDDVMMIIKAKARTAPAHARNLLTMAKSLFQWALDQGTYGLDRSVCADIKPVKIVGDKVARDRSLEDAELTALWAAAEATPYPVGPIYKLLILSGLRLNEVARASWGEFDLAKRTWTIPASRMKGKVHKARPHLVPLIPEMMEIIDGLPRFKAGDFLFSTTFGAKPMAIGSRVKGIIDASMLEQLRVVAKERGDDPRKIKLKAWVNHDLRRSIRSNMAELKIAEEVSEAVLLIRRPASRPFTTYTNTKPKSARPYRRGLRDCARSYRRYHRRPTWCGWRRGRRPCRARVPILPRTSAPGLGAVPTSSPSLRSG